VDGTAPAFEGSRARCFYIASAIALAACNTYDPSLASGPEHDATSSGGAPGTSVGTPPSTSGSGGTGGATAGGSTGGAGTTSDAQTGTPDVVTSDGMQSTPDTGAPDVVVPPSEGGPIDARSEPTVDARPIVDAGPIVESMIDDMEDPDDAILVADGRRGAWFVLNDGTDGGVQSPATGALFTMTAIPGGRGASMYAAHTSGQGFTTWSALFGFWVNRRPAQLKQLYDAHAYNALTFWAKTSASDAAKFSPFVRVQLPDRNTDPDGQICTADGSAGCSDHFGKSITLANDWTKYTIRFNSLQQAGFGMVAPALDAAHLYGVEFQFPLGSTFDCWIDDIAFATVP
jgi:hypothetical protein